MDQVYAKLTVYFEAPFWVGVYERTQSGETQAAKVIFGAEPKEQEVYAYFLKHWGRLQLSPPVAGAKAPKGQTNPKRARKAIAKALEPVGTGTKAQQALQLLREQNKRERHTATNQEKLLYRQRQFALRQQKKKEKHRGH